MFGELGRPELMMLVIIATVVGYLAVRKRTRN